MNYNHILQCPNVCYAAACFSFFFFGGEAPRSRRYGRTAAMRLIVQPYDEDEDDDFFCPFPSNGAPVE
jgi:hypothetical protein